MRHTRARKYIEASFEYFRVFRGGEEEKADCPSQHVALATSQAASS
jgi:hypothetical protein